MIKKIITTLFTRICRLLDDGRSSWPKLVVKAEAIPLQALTAPEGSRRLRLPDFKTIGT
jgi:hypothetical protein